MPIFQTTSVEFSKYNGLQCAIIDGHDDLYRLRIFRPFDTPLEIDAPASEVLDVIDLYPDFSYFDPQPVSNYGEPGGLTAWYINGDYAGPSQALT